MVSATAIALTEEPLKSFIKYLQSSSKMSSESACDAFILQTSFWLAAKRAKFFQLNSDLFLTAEKLLVLYFSRIKI